FVAPYVDDPAPNRASDEGGYLVLDWDGDIVCDSTSGLVRACEVCDACGEPVGRDEALYVSGDGPFCDDCYYENYFTCEVCWETYHVDEQSDRGYLCLDCFADSYAECDNCAEVVSRDDLC